MKYMGSKARIKKEILPIILKDRKENQYFVDLFAGGMNLIDSVDGNRIANDLNYYLIEMWRLLLNGWIPKPFYDREFYNKVKNNKDDYYANLVGWIGFNCSYSGKFFGGYAGKVNTKIGNVRNYQEEALKNVRKQVDNLKGVNLCNVNYYELAIPPNSIIYLDPPYKNTTKYFADFDHDKFYDYCRQKKKEGHTIFISEYEMPEDFICVWEKEVKSSLSANGKIGGSKISTEKLFTL